MDARDRRQEAGLVSILRGGQRAWTDLELIPAARVGLGRLIATRNAAAGALLQQVADLMEDRIAVWSLDAGDGKLSAAAVRLLEGGGRAGDRLWACWPRRKDCPDEEAIRCADRPAAVEAI